jgi:hypothetical protein
MVAGAERSKCSERLTSSRVERYESFERCSVEESWQRGEKENPANQKISRACVYVCAIVINPVAT